MLFQLNQSRIKSIQYFWSYRWKNPQEEVENNQTQGIIELDFVSAKNNYLPTTGVHIAWVLKDSFVICLFSPIPVSENFTATSLDTSLFIIVLVVSIDVLPTIFANVEVWKFRNCITTHNEVKETDNDEDIILNLIRYQ